MAFGAIDLVKAVDSGLFIGSRIILPTKPENNLFTFDVFYVDMMDDKLRFFVSTMTRRLRSENKAKIFDHKDLGGMSFQDRESLGANLTRNEGVGFVFEIPISTQVCMWTMGKSHYWFATECGVPCSIYPYPFPWP